ncbi:hypothetical protein D9M72_622480 [compost metagenome]
MWQDMVAQDGPVAGAIDAGRIDLLLVEALQAGEEERHEKRYRQPYLGQDHRQHRAFRCREPSLRIIDQTKLHQEGV